MDPPCKIKSNHHFAKNNDTMDNTLGLNDNGNMNTSDNNVPSNMDSASNTNVSNLSSALKSVNLSYGNGTTGNQGNGDFEVIAQQQQQQQQQQQGANSSSVSQNGASTLSNSLQQQARMQHYNARQPSRLQQQYSQQQQQQQQMQQVPGQSTQQQPQQQQQQQQGQALPFSNHPASADINNKNATVDCSRISKLFATQPMDGYTLFSHRSAPNGFKVAIVLSELNMPYRTFFLDFSKGEHRCPEFIAVNPNARVPALIDHAMDNLPMWESGAIILHLVNKFANQTGQPLLWADNVQEQTQISSWLFFQTSGHAPMIGQALHFKYFHTNKIQSAVDRYTDEVRRVYGVVEMALAEKREALIMDLDTENAAAYSAGTTPLSQSRFFDYPVWLVGDKITVADLSFVPWNNVVDRIGINIKVEFPEVYKWTKHMMRRPAVIKALRGE
ncbi:Protein URE2 [Hanseniaspora osmophila]|uniref:Protein URE2 n=1 Tax=Hanseniaspora osmophila TaxID=56408 RepID=A0A1E5RNV7_9ASCO|nr:Protein URE2 [Hanseniaspora osmophila]